MKVSEVVVRYCEVFAQQCQAYDSLGQGSLVSAFTAITTCILQGAS